MALQTNLVKRNGIYYCRFYVPKHLQADFGKKEIWRSLKTGNYSEAVRGVKLEIAYMMKPKNYTPIPEISFEEAKIGELAKRYYDWIVDLYQKSFSRASNTQARDKVLRQIKAEQHSATGALEFGESVTFVRQVCSILRVNLTKEWTDFDHRHRVERLSRHFVKAAHSAYTDLIAAEEGSYSNSDVKIVSQNSRHPHITLPQLIERYNSAKENREKSDGLKTKKAAYQRVLLELLDNECSVFSYKRETARQFAEDLGEIPLGVFRGKKYKGMSLKNIIKLTKEDDTVKKLSPSTYNDYMEHFKELLKFIHREEDQVFLDITEGLYAEDKVKAKDKRHPFTHDDLQTLFKHDELIRNRKAARLSYLFWMPLVSLCTSSRLSELLYLRCHDLKQEGDIAYLTITTHDDRGIKTDAGIRYVPVHQRLLDCGFLEFVESVKKQHGADSHLFVDAFNRWKTPAKSYSQEFSRLAGRVGIKTEKKSFHSLRHSFREATREADLSKSITYALGGWEEQGSGDRYGHHYSIKKLNEAMHKLDFSFLDEVLDGQ